MRSEINYEGTQSNIYPYYNTYNDSIDYGLLAPLSISATNKISKYKCNKLRKVGNSHLTPKKKKRK